ncbi:hypothetical protein bcere0007_54830 [Bacillus mycoides]|uniref:EndoU domain-containing protein n=1 Tax=Bacillus TaxID=1386 RepID=UPI0001A034C0|nr:MULTISPECIES: EndoU domain-containing protein [Bacillus]EEK70093.1 hypothetical protein bcere0007_54830 [Bacillus mycoides]MBK5431499.1 EndoU domain-containing protein [Bacillus sp. TH25]
MSKVPKNKPIIPPRLLDKVKNKFKLKKYNGQVTTQSLYDRDATTSSIANIFLGGISKSGNTKGDPVGMYTITPESDLEQVAPNHAPDFNSDKTRAYCAANDENYGEYCLAARGDNNAYQGKNGVYKTIVWLRETRWNQWKEKVSTMFPKDWSAEKIIDVISRSYDVGKKIATSNGIEVWEGRDPITRSLIVTERSPISGEIITAYPIFESI